MLTLPLTNIRLIQVNAALPNVIFFPEENDFSSFLVTAPFRDDWGGQPNPTPMAVDFMYGSDAFSFDFMQNPPGNSTQERDPALIDK